MLPCSKTILLGSDYCVKIGKAQIYCNVGDGAKFYNCEIIKASPGQENKNLTIRITDKSLLEKTGGIVQGMSGSPIIQDNKIIGVVNYVIVDDTKKGYGIFITTMLKEGDKILS